MAEAVQRIRVPSCWPLPGYDGVAFCLFVAGENFRERPDPSSGVNCFLRESQAEAGVHPTAVLCQGIDTLGPRRDRR